MSYDLLVWDGPLPSPDGDARVVMDVVGSGGPLSPTLSTFLDALPSALELEPDRLSAIANPYGSGVLVTLPWNFVSTYAPIILRKAFEHEYSVVDLQRGVVVQPELADEALWSAIQNAAPVAAVRDGSANTVEKQASRADRVSGDEVPVRRMPTGFVTPEPQELTAQTDDQLARYLRQLQSPRVLDRRLAAYELGGWDSRPELVKALAERLGDSDDYVRAFAAQSLGLLADPSVIGVAALASVVRSLGTGPPSDEAATDPLVIALFGLSMLAAKAEPGDRETAIHAIASVRALLRGRPRLRVDSLLDALGG